MSTPPRQSIVFGASGIVGRAIVRLLSSKAGKTSMPVVTAVSRSGSIALMPDQPSVADLPGVRCVAGDALDKQKTVELCRDADAIYCSIGLPYKSSVWERDFPLIVESMLQAASATGAVLVWVDNLYMFGPEVAASGTAMKENSREFTKYGRKPSLRSRLDNMMLEAADSGRCKVAIVRASDFYGPGVINSAMGGDFFRPLVLGGNAMVLGNPKTKHTYTYVPDLACAVVAVAEAGETAWGRAWHCPNSPAETTVNIVDKISKLCGRTKPAKITVISGILQKFLSLFIQPLREMPEMSFVWDNDYLVDHSEFSARFPHLALPTPIDDGLRDTVAWWRAQVSPA